MLLTVFRIQPAFPVFPGTASPDNTGEDLSFRCGHKFLISRIEDAHGGKRTGGHTIIMKGVICDGIDFELLKEYTHHVVRGVLQF